MRVITLVVLMAISLGATLLLQAQMKGYWWLEWLVLMAAGLFILATFFGLWVDADWGYPMATIIFALSLANLLWLYTRTGQYTTFAIGLLANITGVVVSLTGIGKSSEMPQETIETYDVAEKAPAKKTAKKTTKKRGRPKKRKK